MPENTQRPTGSSTKPSYLRRNWLNHRQKRFWAIFAVLLYSLGGFFLIPLFAEHFIVKTIQDATGRDVTIGNVRFNPYVLGLQLEDFDFRDTDGETLISFDELFVNVQASSLYRQVLIFREIRLDGANMLYERFSPVEDRLSRLLADIERLNPAEPDETEKDSGELPRLVVGTLSLNECNVLFRDHPESENVEIPIGPVSATIHDLNTLPGLDGDQHVRIRLEDGALLTWQGNVQLQPFHSAGHVALEGASLDPLMPYLKSTFPIEAVKATLSVNSEYVVKTDESGALSFSLSNLQSRLADAAVSGLVPASEFLALAELAVSGGEFSYPENTLDIQTIRLVDPFVDTWLGEDGQLGLMQMMPGDDETTADAGSTTPWTVSVADFEIENGRVAFYDRSKQPNLALDIEKLSLHLKDVDNRDQTEMPLSLNFGLEEGGSAEIKGSMILLPEISVNGTVTAEGVPLNLVQPYAQQSLAISIEQGKLTTASEFSMASGGSIHLAGNLSVDGLAVHDIADNNELLAWKQMFIDRYEVGGEEATLRISTIAFSEPFCRIHIREDLSTNFGNVFIEPEGQAVPDKGDDGEFTFVIGNLAVDNGSMDFSDFSLPVPFASKMQGLNGTLSAVDSRSAEPSDIRLEGRVGDYGIARIHGVMNLLDPVAHTNLSVEFRNLLMTDLSAYAAQFAGREIDEGKLDLELEYVITDGLLSGVNSAVFSDLVLGKKVESPDSAGLPLDLAVALLKDSKGMIDVKLSVEGDIRHPEFRLSGVIWQAAGSLVTRAVKAPFKLLGNLVGIESDDFGQFKFLGGRYDLAPPELEKVSQLKQALAHRPKLILEISGAWNAAVDRPALQYYGLREAVGEHLRRDYSEGGDAADMFDEEVLKIFEEIHAERFPGSSLEEMRDRHTVPPPHEPEGNPVFDQTAFASELRKLLVDSQPVSDSELKSLANQRAQAIMDAFLANNGLDPSRVRVIKPAKGKSKDGEWVAMELGVSHH